MDFIKYSENLTLYSAFIKHDILKEIIKQSEGHIQQIVVRWKAEDLIRGVSDLEVFDLCSKNEIALYRNPKLHAKCIVNEKGDCILGSANFSNSGMLNSDEANWELNTKVEDIDLTSRVLLQRILMESDLVTKEYVELVKEILHDQMINTDTIKLPEIDKADYLLSSLPMCHHPELLWEIEFEKRIVPFEELNAAAHDLALFDMTLVYESKDSFFKELKQNFSKQPFINELISHIKEVGSCRYGEIVNWIKEKCIEVPIPRSWEIKKKLIVNILYEWISYFNEDISYISKYPKGSDKIQYLRSSN